MSPELPPPLKRHFAESGGHFSPFTYSIGLTSSLAATAQSQRPYPLETPVTPSAHEDLARVLALEHESVHLVQYLSTSFGLRTLRRTNIALRYLAENVPAELPVLQTMWNETSSGSESHGHVLARFLAFFDAADQLRLHRADIPPRFLAPDPSVSAGDTVEISWEPWTPMFFNTATSDLHTRRALATELEDALQIQYLPHLIFRTPRRGQRVVLNAAALMEAFAIVIELNILSNALGVAYPDAVMSYFKQLEQDGLGYTASLTFATSAGAIRGPYVNHMFAVLVDVSLMYDPFVLFDAPLIDLPVEGQHRDQLPGETFVHACAVARDVTPITSNDPEDQARFYHALCDGMNIPSPEWMAAKALECATNLLAQAGDAPTTPLLHDAFFMHHAALQVRMKQPAVLPAAFLGNTGIVEVLEPCRPYITFYQLRSGTPEKFDESNLNLVSIHGMLWQALAEYELECPLDIGSPFSCHAEPNGPCRFVGDCFVKNVARVRNGVLESLNMTGLHRP